MIQSRCESNHKSKRKSRNQSPIVKQVYQSNYETVYISSTSEYEVKSFGLSINFSKKLMRTLIIKLFLSLNFSLHLLKFIFKHVTI